MKRFAGLVGISAVVAGVVVVAVSGGGAVAAASGAGEVQSSLVEDFAYPHADRVLAEHGLVVKTGDGRIQVVGSGTGAGACAPGLIQVETLVDEEPYGGYFCFETSGSRGFLTLEVPHTFLVRGGDEPVEATAKLENGAQETYDVGVNQSVAVDPGGTSQMPTAILVELRFGAW
ncbi:hypothetical protein [Cellulomonas sp.]|uniref:hypothetical protein n=1 Tax=Cellulomonas sp. TaxID=40001 RepID=UPI002810AB61|nr:hypothetical protein [Cellulomonas sp.]